MNPTPHLGLLLLLLQRIVLLLLLLLLHLLRRLRLGRGLSEGGGLARERQILAGPEGLEPEQQQRAGVEVPPLVKQRGRMGHTPVKHG
jgi:hypothetical protein